MTGTIRTFITTPTPARDWSAAIAAAVVSLAGWYWLGQQDWAIGAVTFALVAAAFIAGIAVGFLPIIIAARRRHHQTGLIVALTLLGVVPVIGWVTWILALVMAAATAAQPAQQVAWAGQSQAQSWSGV